MFHGSPGVVATIIAAGLAVSACGSSEEVVDLSFSASFTERTVIDGGVSGPSHGDNIPGSGDLRNSDGEVIGEFNTVSFVTGTTDELQGRVLLAEYAFDGGLDSLVIAGAGVWPPGDELLKDRTYTYPVIGGTGNYAGARGECSVTRKDSVYNVNCRFSVLPE